MIKPWKELEGQPLSIDVGSTRALALKAGADKASTLYLTTEGSVVMNGEEIARTPAGMGRIDQLTTASTHEQVWQALTGLDAPTASDISTCYTRLAYGWPFEADTQMAAGRIPLIMAHRSSSLPGFPIDLAFCLMTGAGKAVIRHVRISCDYKTYEASVASVTDMPITA